MADFVRMKYENFKLKQSQIAKQLGYSTSTLQRYRDDINMLSPYRIQPNNINKRTKKFLNTKFDNNSHRLHNLKRTQLTSNDLVKHNLKYNKRTKNILKAGSVQENFEINDKYLD